MGRSRGVMSEAGVGSESSRPATLASASGWADVDCAARDWSRTNIPTIAAMAMAQNAMAMFLPALVIRICSYWFVHQPIILLQIRSHAALDDCCRCGDHR